MALAEALERRTKPAGKRNGVLGYVGLTVLRCLMFTFLNAKTGLCCPAYSTILKASDTPSIVFTSARARAWS
jgi:hypothetical protein